MPYLLKHDSFIKKCFLVQGASQRSMDVDEEHRSSSSLSSSEWEDQVI